jgi:hypothetical protein
VAGEKEESSEEMGGGAIEWGRGRCGVRFERKVEFGDLVGEEIGEGLDERRG